VIATRPDARTFGVRARGQRPAAFEQGTLALAGEIGAWIEGETGWTVDLSAPDIWFEVVFLGSYVVVAGRRIEGPGGLPVGTSGHAVALVSGGIDSPVAAWLMMGRGLRTSVVHFHSAPFTSAASQEKVRRLAGILTRFQPTIAVCTVPFADLQRTLAASTPPRLRVLLYRRFMVRIAQELARGVEATCLVTGDALAQVASQTVANIAAIDAVATLPVLRPLIGMAKPEVIAHARRLGTYEISIEPHDDCSAFLLPERVAAAATAAELDVAERDLPVADMVQAAIGRREVFNARFERAPGSASPAPHLTNPVPPP
jgi:thiamine biosynthesis protein ThiI